MSPSPAKGPPASESGGPAGLQALLGAAVAGLPRHQELDGLPDELEAGLPAAPFGPRGLALRARAPLGGVQVHALRPAWVQVAFEAAGLRAEQLARLSRDGHVTSEPSRPGRLLLEAPQAALVDCVVEDPALAPLLAAHRFATAPPAPPRAMGVVNVTPDSFSDGGTTLDPEAAIAHGRALVEAGADLLDLGAESTRPGADPVPEAEELERVLPVLEGLCAAGDTPLSIDTTKAGVARAALGAGARWVNDVSAGRLEPELLEVTAEAGAGLVLMHMRGTPRTMQSDPHYDDVVAEVTEHLRERVAAAWRAGVAVPKIQVDPGIGFGKRLRDNLDLIRALPELRSLGRPILLGVSRKSFLGRLGGIEAPAERLTDTAAAVTAGVLLGAEVLRVHDVAALAPALAVASALAGHAPPEDD